MTGRATLLAGLLAAGPLVPFAVAAPPGEGAGAVCLTLAEAVERARRSSARLAELRSLETGAEAGLRAARAARLPQLDLGASYTRNSDVPELTITAPGLGTRTIFPNIPDNYRVRAGVSLPLYTGGRLAGTVEAAAAQRSAAGTEVRGGEADLVLETRVAYWSLVAARESARVLSEAVASFEAHLKDARNRADYGMAARNEVLAVQVERDRAELSRLQAGSAAEVANANLVRLAGLPADARIEPVEPLAAPPAVAEEVEPLVAAALGARPEVAALGARVTTAQAGVKIARAASLPDARLAAGYDYANPNPRILPLVPNWKGTWSVSVSLAFTAFDAGRASALGAQAGAQAEALSHQLEDLVRRIRLEVTTRRFELTTARESVAVADRSLEAAGENLRVSQDRYREGVIQSSDLLDAEVALLRAGLDQTTVATQLHVALANLEHAVGR